MVEATMHKNEKILLIEEGSLRIFKARFIVYFHHHTTRIFRYLGPTSTFWRVSESGDSLQEGWRERILLKLDMQTKVRTASLADIRTSY